MTEMIKSVLITTINWTGVILLISLILFVIIFLYLYCKDDLNIDDIKDILCMFKGNKRR